MQLWIDYLMDQTALIWQENRWEKFWKNNNIFFRFTWKYFSRKVSVNFRNGYPLSAEYVIVSIMDLLRNMILSWRVISWFFILLRIPVIKWIPLTKSISANSLDIYPLSPNNFPDIFLRKFPSFNDWRSSTLPEVITKSIISPLSFTIRCSLNP